MTCFVIARGRLDGSMAKRSFPMLRIKFIQATVLSNALDHFVRGPQGIGSGVGEKTFHKKIRLITTSSFSFSLRTIPRSGTLFLFPFVYFNGWRKIPQSLFFLKFLFST